MYHLLNHKKLMFLLLDLEIGGECCGIVQLSVEIVRVKKKREAKGVEKDMIANMSGKRCLQRRVGTTLAYLMCLYFEL